MLQQNFPQISLLQRIYVLVFENIFFFSAIWLWYNYVLCSTIDSEHNESCPNKSENCPPTVVLGLPLWPIKPYQTNFSTVNKCHVTQCESQLRLTLWSLPHPLPSPHITSPSEDYDRLVGKTAELEGLLHTASMHQVTFQQEKEALVHKLSEVTHPYSPLLTHI